MMTVKMFLECLVAVIGLIFIEPPAPHAGWLPIHDAALKGDVEALSAALEAAPEIDVPISEPGSDYDGLTALMLAAKGGWRACTDLLVKAGAAVTVRAPHGETALHFAAGSGDPHVTATLIEAEADVAAMDKSQRTPLMLAAVACAHESVQLLLAAGAEVDQRGEEGWTALMSAARSGQPGCEAVIARLAEAGADMNARWRDGTTPLHLATNFGDVPTMVVLMKRGARPSEKDQLGNTPLHQAMLRQDAFKARALISGEADVNAQNNDGLTPLMMAAMYSDAASITVLLGAKPSLDLADKDGRTALHWAVLHSEPGLSDMLLAGGAPPNPRDGSGLTPLMYAVEGCDGETIAIMQRHGVSLQLRTPMEDTLLMIAAAAKPGPSVLELLVENGGPVDAVNVQGRTALHVAAAEGHADNVRRLLRLGVNRGALDARGCSALDLATERRDEHRDAVIAALSEPLNSGR